jgi:hypothetical protein
MISFAGVGGGPGIVPLVEPQFNAGFGRLLTGEKKIFLGPISLT